MFDDGLSLDIDEDPFHDTKIGISKTHTHTHTHTHKKIKEEKAAFVSSSCEKHLTGDRVYTRQSAEGTNQYACDSSNY